MPYITFKSSNYLTSVLLQPWVRLADLGNRYLPVKLQVVVRRFNSFSNLSCCIPRTFDFLCTIVSTSAIIPFSRSCNAFKIRGKHFWISDFATSALASSRHVTSSTSLVDCVTIGTFLLSFSTNWEMFWVCLSMVSVNWVYLWRSVEWEVMVHSRQIACSQLSQ